MVKLAHRFLRYVTDSYVLLCYAQGQGFQEERM